MAPRTPSAHSKAQPNRHAESATITKFEIFPNNGGEPLEISGGVTELRYFEDVLSSTVRVKAIVIDTGHASKDRNQRGQINVIDFIRQGNGEKVHLFFEDNLGNKYKFIGDNALYVNEKIELPSHNLKLSYQLELVSKEFLTNEEKRVLERYDGKISNSAEKILKKVLNTPKDLDIDVTENSYNFLGTTKKPMWVLLWLAKRCVPQREGAKGKSAGYFFFETYDGYKFKSIETLFDQEIKKKYIFNNVPDLPEGYDGKILHYDPVSNSSLKNKLQLGTYNSRNTSADAYSSKYDEKELTISAQKSGVNPLGFSYDKFINKIFTESISKFNYRFTDTGFLPSGASLSSQLGRSKVPNLNKDDTLNQSAMRYNQVFTMKIDITIAGDFSLRSGDLIYCDFPEVSSKNNQVASPWMSGIYMISAICHRITPKDTYTSLELTRDSYGKKLPPTTPKATPIEKQPSRDQLESDLLQLEIAQLEAERDYFNAVADYIEAGGELEDLRGLSDGRTAADELNDYDVTI